MPPLRVVVRVLPREKSAPNDFGYAKSFGALFTYYHVGQALTND
jgi:hypothetical protein